ncbi:MAG: MerR family transcriptional regulator [Dehalococcoidia bacterium]|nr:MerR family transcriptional regulator [Dehalococcoidia bacterium]
MRKPGIFRIAQVEAMTGVSAHALRAWERRYGVPRPSRTGGQQRTYSEADIAMIRRMHELATQGVPLARAAEIVLQEAATPGEGTGPRIALLKTELFDALLAFDEQRAAAAWTELFDTLDLLSGLERVVVPLMRDIGIAWHEQRITIAQEHFASNFVRARLDQLSRQVQPLPGAPTVVLACLEGEHHEIGLLMLAVMLRFQGIRTIYLGQDVPDEDLIRTVEDAQPEVLAVNAGTAEGARHLPGVVNALAETAPLTAIVYGGGAFDADPSLRIETAYYGGPRLVEAVALINQLGRSRITGGAA